jgi:hypothetical protein
MTPTYFANSTDEGTFTPSDADNARDAAAAYAWAYSIEKGDCVHVVLATERLPEDGDGLDADAEVALDVRQAWVFRVGGYGEDDAVMEEVRDGE